MERWESIKQKMGGGGGGWLPSKYVTYSSKKVE